MSVNLNADVVGFSSLGWLVIIITVVLMAFIVYFYNSGGDQTILQRIWSFISRHEFDDQILKGYHRDQLELGKFFFMYGVSAKSVHAARDAVHWARGMGVPLRKLAAAGKWVDFSTRKVYKPKRKSVIILYLMVVFIFLMAVFSMGISLKNYALIKPYEHNGWLWANNVKVYPVTLFGSPDWKLDDSACRGEFNHLEKNIVNLFCEKFTTPEFSYFIHSNIKFQRWFFFFITVFLLVIFVIFLRLFVSCISASSIYKRYLDYHSLNK